MSAPDYTPEDREWEMFRMAVRIRKRLNDETEDLTPEDRRGLARQYEWARQELKILEDRRNGEFTP